MKANKKELSTQLVNKLRAEGGCILQGRVGGQLAITRALGDLAFKTIVFMFCSIFRAQLTLHKFKSSKSLNRHRF